ncbi:MAG: DUF6261 family protein [Tannerellaceae bacterium]|jgi:hypothetical protein|nr:DUF6261 family protein [Tannerellaceae bacterium]
MQILRLNLKSLHNEEWFNLFTDFKNEIPIYGGAEKLGVKKLYELLTPLYSKADHLLIVLRKSVYTEAMREADKDRNALFTGMYNVIKASRALPGDDKKDAAKRLFILISDYRKSAINSSYTEESSAIHNFLQDVKGKYAPYITLLQLDTWVNDLKAAEQKFLDCRALRTQEDVEKPTERFADVRKEMDLLYQGIVDSFHVQLLADGLSGDVNIDPEDLKTGIYEEDTPTELRGNVVYNFVVAWNRILKRYADMLAVRAGRRAKDKDTEEEEEPSGPVED